MKVVKLRLNSVDKVKVFLRDICNMKGEYDIEQGRTAVDAKSMLGIFTLDLKEPFDLKIYDDEQYPFVLSKFKNFAA